MSEMGEKAEISAEGERTEFVVVVGGGKVSLETRGIWPSRTFNLTAYIHEEVRKAQAALSVRDGSPLGSRSEGA